MSKGTYIVFCLAIAISAAVRRNESDKPDHFYFMMANGTITRVDLTKPPPVTAAPQAFEWLDPCVCYLYNSYTGLNPARIYYDSCPLGYDPSRITYCLAHGWTDNWKGPCLQTIVQAFMLKTNYQLIVCDCPKLRSEYAYATLRVKSCGEDIAGIFTNLKYCGGSPTQLHCIGHSLGAHICGNMCRCMKKRCNSIIACDAAWPLIASYDSCLHWSDCDYLTAFHTEVTMLGIDWAFADCDYYCNCGKNQYGCEDKGFIDSVTRSCDHNYVCKFIAELIKHHECFSTTLKCPSDEHALTNTCQETSTTYYPGDCIHKRHPPGIYNIRTHSCYKGCPHIV